MVKIFRGKRITPPVEPTSSLQLLFSDLTHGPKTGWSAADPNRGAAVSVWHYSFGGGPRGSNYITVCGQDLTDDADYAEWDVVSQDHPFIKRTTFWLNSDCVDGAGTITITVNGETSNTVPFTIISGNIKFVDKDYGSQGNGSLTNPFNNPTYSVMNGLIPGDILYFRETATPYNQRYLGGTQTFYLSGANGGSQNAPIAVVSYPGETCEIVAEEAGVNIACWALVQSWWTCAKFKLTASWYAIGLVAGAVRAVGNDCVGCKIFNSGVGILYTYSNRDDMLGNSAHGGRSSHKLDHAIYVSGNPSNVRGSDVGWNYIYDNDFKEGAMLSINHQGTRIPNGASCKEHRVHHNWVDATTYGGRGVQIYDMSWEFGNPNGEDEPETALIYNNIFIGVGYAGASIGCMQMTNGKAKFYNNTVINGISNGITTGMYAGISCEWVNNVIHMASGNYVYHTNSFSGVTIDNNSWFGAGSSPLEDSNAINTDPMLDPTTYMPLVGSPCIDAGSSVVSGIVTDDFYGNPRISVDVGAVEKT